MVTLIKKKKSTRKMGAYYLRRTVIYYKNLGYDVEKLEVNFPFFIGGRTIFSRRDLLGADIAIWKKETNEFFLVQVKSTTEERENGVNKMKSEAKVEFEKKKLPECIKKKIIIWLPRQRPIVIEMGG